MLYAENWEVAKEKNGVKVYTRKTTNSEVREFRATMKMKTTVSDLVALLFDVDKSVEWIPECTYSYLVEKIKKDW